MLNWRDPQNPLAGGAERVSQGYLEALVQRGHHAAWFANDFPGADRQTVINGIQVVRGGGKGTSILHARRWHSTEPPFDLIIDQHHGIPWYAPWWSNSNCVAYIHEVLGPIWDSFYPWPISAFGRAQERWTHRLYRSVPFWTASDATRRHLLEHGVKQVKLIPYGVHTVALPDLEAKLPAPPYELIMVSRLAPNKRIDHGILALKELIQRGCQARLTIVGAGETEPLLKRLRAELALDDLVTFTGPLDEESKDALLRKAHLLLHTSQREGWGLNVIEANAMGTPSAVYPVEGLRESTLHNETGVWAASQTPAALAEAVIALLSGPADIYQRFRVNAWNRAKTFHWSKVLPLACDWLENMARSPGSPRALSS